MRRPPQQDGGEYRRAEAAYRVGTHNGGNQLPGRGDGEGRGGQGDEEIGEGQAVGHIDV